MTTNNQSAGSGTNTPGILILAAWLFVGIPLVWGVSQTFKNALNLFKSSPQQAAATTTKPSTMP
ncbi:MAG TPA: hypothetical protein VKK61_01840 [Tepidisphaeraceae bacterium]|jgi:hypothetical protein|nr:hypothetical protein [Tepidisphaeraceae bacterium]